MYSKQSLNGVTNEMVPTHLFPLTCVNFDSCCPLLGDFAKDMQSGAWLLKH